MKGIKKQGFTLIELLVVVLIIGILAAVALPQYEKAVVKSKVAAIIPWYRIFKNGMKMYILENGAQGAMQDFRLILPTVGVTPGEVSCNGGIGEDGRCVQGSTFKVNDKLQFHWNNNEINWTLYNNTSKTSYITLTMCFNNPGPNQKPYFLYCSPQGRDKTWSDKMCRMLAPRATKGMCRNGKECYEMDL